MKLGNFYHLIYSVDVLYLYDYSHNFSVDALFGLHQYKNYLKNAEGLVDQDVVKTAIMMETIVQMIKILPCLGSIYSKHYCNLVKKIWSLFIIPAF